MAYVAIRIDEGAAEALNKYAAEKGLTKSQAILSALKGDEADTLLEQLDNKSEEFVPGTIVDMSDWVDGEAPACCIDTISNSFKPGHICQDWVRLEYTDKNGLRRQNWFNKRTGEYEFSERWKKIKSEYEYQ